VEDVSLSISFSTARRSGGDLFDSSNSRAMERFNGLTVRLTQLQRNYENNHLRYR
jgi:hypothetical protein